MVLRHREDNSGELDNLESPLVLRMLGFPVGCAWWGDANGMGFLPPQNLLASEFS